MSTPPRLAYNLSNLCVSGTLIYVYIEDHGPLVLDFSQVTEFFAKFPHLADPREFAKVRIDGGLAFNDVHVEIEWLLEKAEALAKIAAKASGEALLAQRSQSKYNPVRLDTSDDYRLTVTFQDGQVRRVDIRTFLHGASVIKTDISAFHDVYIEDGHVITWKKAALSIDAEIVYLDGIPVPEA